MKKVIQFSITNEDGMYVASGINAPIVTDGKTFEELEKNIQEFTDKFCKEIDVLCKAKEKEILEI